MSKSNLLLACAASSALLMLESAVLGDVTADGKDAWLILYNVTGADADSNGIPDSIEWKDWFVSTHGISNASTLGLSCTTSEWIKTQAELEATITDPVNAYLDTNTNAERIIGILLGHNLPGIWGTEQDGLQGINDPDVPNGHHGGRSIASTLADLRTGSQLGIERSKTTAPNENRRGSSVVERICDLPIAQGRLTRSTMAADTYITARIDGPSLEAAKRLTQRALAFSRGEVIYGANDALWYDYDDAQFGLWSFLQSAVDKFSFLHWLEYTLDQPTDNPTNDILRFGWHMNKTWANTDNPPKTFAGLCETPFGPRLLAMHLISYGGTTLRCRRCDERPRLNGADNPNYMSTTGVTFAQFAVNALWPDCDGDGVIEDDGFASVIVATGEPGPAGRPFPELIVPFLDRGWTAAETYFVSQSVYHWVFTYVGDPFLTSPRFPRDCNENDVSDSVDLAGGTSLDANTNGVPDECEPDCNNNSVGDACDLIAGTSTDCNVNDVPDECDFDCDGGGVPDDCEIAAGTADDCDLSGVLDTCEIAAGSSQDVNTNAVLDIRELPDFDTNGVIDLVDFAAFQNCENSSDPNCTDAFDRDAPVDGVITKADLPFFVAYLTGPIGGFQMMMGGGEGGEMSAPMGSVPVEEQGTEPPAALTASLTLEVQPVGGGAAVGQLQPGTAYELHYVADCSVIETHIVYAVAQDAASSITGAVAPIVGDWSEAGNFMFTIEELDPPAQAPGLPVGHYRFAGMLNGFWGETNTSAGGSGHLLSFTTGSAGALAFEAYLIGDSDGTMVSMEATLELDVVASE